MILPSVRKARDTSTNFITMIPNTFGYFKAFWINDLASTQNCKSSIQSAIMDNQLTLYFTFPFPTPTTPNIILYY